jgi:hypothetical protein
VREEWLDEAIRVRLADIDLSEGELAFARSVLSNKTVELERDHAAQTQALRLQRDRLDAKLARLTDLLVDGTVEKTLFSARQHALLLERARIQDQLRATEANSSAPLESIEKTVELARSPSTLYRMASPEKKRQLAKILLSNLSVSGKNVDVTLALPFRLIAEREKTTGGRPHRGTCRTWEEILNQLIAENLIKSRSHS